MSVASASPQYSLLPVLNNREVAEETFLLTLDAGALTSKVRPGQFFMVSVSPVRDPLLPRPFAAFDFRSGQLDILCRKRGAGTRLLSKVAKDESIWVLGPLGHPFRIPEPVASTPLVIAGGIGLASVHLLVREFLLRGIAVKCLYGIRTGLDMVPLEAALREDERLDLALATEDGSLGYRGNLYQLYVRLAGEDPGFQKKYGPAFLCGPMPMLRRFAATFEAQGMAAQFSLESRMACGYGVCQGCATYGPRPLQNGLRRFPKVCCEGPVFPLEEIDWGTLYE